jgi:hypothetical protein
VESIRSDAEIEIVNDKNEIMMEFEQAAYGSSLHSSIQYYSEFNDVGDNKIKIPEADAPKNEKMISTATLGGNLTPDFEEVSAANKLYDFG